MTGTIRELRPSGFGFVTPDDNPHDSVYFHVTALRDVAFSELRPGLRVRFERGIDPRSRRERAITVQLLEADASRA